jgi:hypothetical protein
MDPHISQTMNKSGLNTSISTVDSLSYTGHLLVGTMLVIFGKCYKIMVLSFMFTYFISNIINFMLMNILFEQYNFCYHNFCSSKVDFHMLLTNKYRFKHVEQVARMIFSLHFKYIIHLWHISVYISTILFFNSMCDFMQCYFSGKGNLLRKAKL